MGHLSEQVRQNKAWGFGLHAVDPEVGTAGMILVAPVKQLEVVRLRVEGLCSRREHGDRPGGGGGGHHDN